MATPQTLMNERGLNVLNYGLVEERIFEQNMRELGGYERKTTFCADFGTAELFGKSGIIDTYKRSVKHWANNVVYFTELVMVLNFRCNIWYQRGNVELSKIYADLFYMAQDLGYQNFTGKDLDYFIRTLD